MSARVAETLFAVAFGAVLACALHREQPATLPVYVNPPVVHLTLEPDAQPEPVAVACESKSNPPEETVFPAK